MPPIVATMQHMEWDQGSILLPNVLDMDNKSIVFCEM